MVMGAVGDIRNYLKKMPYTVRVGNIPGGMSEFINIQAAINYAVSQTPTAANPWTIDIYPGTYDEALTMGDHVNLVGVGERSVILIQTGAGDIITVGNVTCQLMNLALDHSGGGAGACLATTNAGADIYLEHCQITGMPAAVHVIEMIAGQVEMHDCEVLAGDIDLSSAACTFIAHYARIENGDIDLAGAFDHVLELHYVDMHGGDIANAATGAVDIDLRYVSDIGAFTDAGTAGTVLFEYSVATSATKSGTSPWVSRVSDLFILSNTNGTGAITCFAGLINTITRAVGPIVWYKDGETLRVLPSGTSTDTVIQWAINAAVADDTIEIAEGTYTEPLVFDAAADVLTLRGDSADKVLITLAGGTTVTITDCGPVCFENLTLQGTAMDGDQVVNMNAATGAASATFRNVIINGVRTGTSAYGIYTQGANGVVLILRDCNITMTGAATTYGIYTATSSAGSDTLDMVNVFIDAPTDDLNLSNDCIVISWHCTYNTGGITIASDANCTLACHSDNILGLIVKGADGVMIYKNANQQYEVWAGMEIGDSITAAAADTPAPADTDPYTILIHPGIYDEAIICSTWVNLKGIGPKGSVVIAQNDADIITLADNVELENFTVRLTGATGSQRLIWDNGVACTFRITNLIMEIIAGFAQAHRCFAFTGGSNGTIENCEAISQVTHAGYNLLHCSTAAVTIHLINNNFSGGGGRLLQLSVGGTITGNGNRWAGVAAFIDFSVGTITLDNDAILCTGTWSNAGFANVLILRNCAIEAPVVAGDLAIVRMKNCSYRAISRTGTGNIVDESPTLKDAPWKVHRWTWQAALANAQVTVRGTPLDAGSGQVLLEVTDDATESEAVEQFGEIAGSLANEFTPARTPRFLTQISVDSFDAHAYMFFGLRNAVSDYVPVATEDHAGFIWDGANFMASSDDGIGIQQTNLTTPTVNTHTQLEVIVFGGITTVGWVEFYVDGILVATHSTRIPVLVLDWQHLLEADSSGIGDEIDVTVRTGGCAECPS